MARLFPLRTRFQRDVAEIENYFDTYARRHPGVSCTMLRYQPAIGPGLRTQITRYLSQPVCPTYMGFDPRIQLVGIDDALEAIVAAVRNPVPGAVNVAGPGTIGLARMIRLAGRRALPIAAPLFGAVTSAGQRLGLDAQSEDFQRLLRYGRGVDTRRLTDEVGYDAAPVDRRGGRGLGGEREDGDSRVNGREASGGRGPLRSHAVPTAIDFMRRLRAGLDSGLELPEAITRGATALPRDARETVDRILDRLDGDYAEDEWGFDEELRRARRARSSPSSTRRWWRVKVDRRRARAGARPRAAHVEPRRHPALGRDDDLDGAAARAPAAALPALPRAQLGVRPALDLGRDAQGRRRRGLAVQRDAAARAGPARGRLPRGREGDGQAVLGALPAPALRPRRLRRDRAAHRRADRAGGRRRQRGDLPEARRPAGRWRA